jgi:protein involved in polysaccharide export with SLBB domain
MQNPVVQQQIQVELQKRGLNQTEVDARLREKGIDVSNIKPEDVPRLEAQIQAVLKEMEAEKMGKKSKSKVDDGEVENVDVSEPEPFEVKNKDVKLGTQRTIQTRGGTDLKVDEISKAIKSGESVDVAIAEKLDESKETSVLAPVYGMQVFRNKSIKVFRNVDDVKAADNYVLGVGDQLAVSIWGVAEYEGVLTINKEGYVQPDKMPRIYLRGVTYGKAKEILKAKFGQYYPVNNERFSVTVNYKRTLTVNIYGEVFTPGGYTLPATNTAFNALVASGGPSDMGSVRRIQLLREGAKPRTIDVYEFMNDPSIRDKFYLEDNDIIHVPIADRIVTIEGAVKRPYSYELLPGENLSRLFDFAGSLADSAYTDIIQIKRYVNNKQVLLDVKYSELKALKKDFDLMSGDIVMVNKIGKVYDNFVAISGAVDFPKSYELTPGMKISDLLSKAVLSKNARQDVAFLQRTNLDGTFSYSRINLEEILTGKPENNLELKPKDKLIVYGLEKFTDRYSINITGCVRLPQRYPFDASKQLKVEDALLLAGGLKPDASDVAYVMRRKTDDPMSKEYIRVNIKNLLLNKTSSDNFYLQPSDSLFVLSKSSFKDVFLIKVSGAVRNPGEYQYDSSLRLKDVLTLCGGLQLQGASNRVEISRVEMRNNAPTRVIVQTVSVNEDYETENGDIQLLPFDQIVVRTIPEFSFQKSVTLQGEVMYPGTYVLTDKNETLKSVIERAGGLTAEAFLKGSQLYRIKDEVGFIVMNLESAMKDGRSKYNYILVENDVLTIPKMRDFVTIEGATNARDLFVGTVAATGKLAVPFYKGRRANYYVNNFTGGFSKNASKTDITVLYPNGSIKGTVNLGLFKIYPHPSKGSTIKVGYKESLTDNKAKSEKKEKVEWEKLFSSTIAQASGILTLILLAQQLSK